MAPTHGQYESYSTFGYTIGNMDLFSGDLCPQNPVPSRCPTLASLVALLDGIPALLWATDLELRFTSLTGAGLEATGIRVKDFAGKPIESLFQDSGRKQLAMRAHRRALQGQAGMFRVHAGGRDLEAHVQALRGTNARRHRNCRRRTGCHRAAGCRARLRLSEQSSRLLIEEAPYAICRITESGQLLQVNRVMLETLGYGPGTEADLLAYDLPPVFAAPADFVKLRQALVSGTTVQGFETTWVGRSGRRFRCGWAAAPSAMRPEPFCISTCWRKIPPTASTWKSASARPKRCRRSGSSPVVWPRFQ